MSTWLVVGLGNPGSEYAANRHNIGFMVVDELAKDLRAPSFRSKFGAELSEVSLGGDKLLLLKPQQYMNLSGIATQQAATFYKVPVGQTIVVHDEIDLPYETLRVKLGGGHGGHNGLRSMSENLGPEYLRVRCGVGKPQATGDRERVIGHVLGDFSKQERSTLPIFIGEAASAVRAIVEVGAIKAMNQFNQGQKKESK
jgi:PTH1 family peptidyl-tRNA hydrolase